MLNIPTNGITLYSTKLTQQSNFINIQGISFKEYPFLTIKFHFVNAIGANQPILNINNDNSINSYKYNSVDLTSIGLTASTSAGDTKFPLTSALAIGEISEGFIFLFSGAININRQLTSVSNTNTPDAHFYFGAYMKSDDVVSINISTTLLGIFDVNTQLTVIGSI